MKSKVAGLIVGLVLAGSLFVTAGGISSMASLSSHSDVEVLDVIDKVAADRCVRDFYIKDAPKSATSDLAEAVKSFGIKGKKLQGEIVSSIEDSVAYKSMMRDVASGKKGDYGKQLSRIVSKEIVNSVGKQKGNFDKLKDYVLEDSEVYQVYKMLKNPEKVKIDEKSVKDGLTNKLYDVLMDSNPITEVIGKVTTTVNVGKIFLETESYDRAYEKYKEKSANGTMKVDDSDCADICVTGLRGYDTMMERQYREEYAKSMNIKLSEIDKDEALKNRLNKEASEELRKSFEMRVQKEKNLSQYVKDYGLIIRTFDKADLLYQGLYGYEKAESLQDRVEELIEQRDMIMDMAGGKLLGEKNNQVLVICMKKWLEEKDPSKRDEGKFKQWMIDNDYIKGKKTVAAKPVVKKVQVPQDGRMSDQIRFVNKTKRTIHYIFGHDMADPSKGVIVDPGQTKHVPSSLRFNYSIYPDGRIYYNDKIRVSYRAGVIEKKGEILKTKYFPIVGYVKFPVTLQYEGNQVTMKGNRVTK